MSAARVLVVEHEANAGAGLVGERLTAAGIEWTVVGPAAGRDVPTSVEGYDGVVVLGGTPGPTDDDAATWLPQVRALIADCLARSTPYLGICLGAQLLAVVAGGRVTEARRGPEVGVTELSLTEEALGDPLLTGLPRTTRALQWHFLEVSRLPEGSTSMCSSDLCDNQAFRVGPHAWGLQFHLEALASTAAEWAAEGEELAALGIDPATLVADVRAAEPELRAWWSAVSDRWIALVVAAAQTSRSGGS